MQAIIVPKCQFIKQELAVVGAIGDALCGDVVTQEQGYPKGSGNQLH